uniref:PBPb domain-containing protein n=1 Tax=Panagrellus redivivus TaxID=6233 RepID=A0A7E4V7U9_PANRE
MSVSVGFIEVESDAYKCFRQVPRRKCERPGAEVEIIQLAFQMLNLTWRGIDVEQTFGIPPDLGSKLNSTTWSGMMGLLTTGKIDMSGLSMHITPERMEDVIFAFPLRYFQTIYVVRKPNETYSQNFIVNAFPLNFWMIAMATFFVVWGIHILHAFIVKLNEKKKVDLFWRESGRSLMQLVSANLRQTIPLNSQGALFILNALYMLAMIIILNYYQSAIFSNLVAPNFYKIPFRNREELAVAIKKGEVFMTDIHRSRPYCAYECTDLYKALETNPMKVRQSASQVFADIANNGVFQSKLDVNFIPAPFNWFSRRKDKIIIKDTREVAHYTAFAFAKSQRLLRQRFNQAIVELLPAVEHITTAHGYRTRRRRYDPVEEQHFLALSLHEHFVQVFYLYAIGIGVAIISFVLEIGIPKIYDAIVSWRNQRRHNE